MRRFAVDANDRFCAAEADQQPAVTLLKPNVVHVPLPKRTLNNDAELKAWLSEVEQLLADKLKTGPVAL